MTEADKDMQLSDSNKDPGVLEMESPFIQNLADAGLHLWEVPLPDYALRETPEIWRPTWYFFYGTLSNPTTLAKVLNLSDPPAMVPASVRSYSLARWGRYPALIDEGPMDNVVRGQAYLVQSEDDEDRLAYYETKNYRSTAVIISVENTTKEEISGRAFLFVGDPQELEKIPD